MKLKLNVGKEKKNIACHCKSKEIIIWTKILIFSRNEEKKLQSFSMPNANGKEMKKF